MSGINSLLSCINDAPCFDNVLTSPGSEKSNIIALALIEKGQLAANDFSETNVRLTPSVADSVIGFVREMQVLGKAVFFPSGHLNGIKLQPEEKMQTITFGLQNDPQPTGETLNGFQFKYEYFYTTQGVEWFNWLRKNLGKYDLVFWTENYVHFVEGKKLTFFNIGAPISGNAAETIVGGFDVKYLGDGEPIPYVHSTVDLLEGFTSLTIGNPTIDILKLAFTDCSDSNCKTYVSLPSTVPLSTTLSFDVVDFPTETSGDDIDVNSCLTWEIYENCGTTKLASNASPTKIDPLTGVVTLTTFPANTERKYTVVAITNSCVRGEFCFKIRTNPA